MDCQIVRTEIHFEPADPALQAHLQTCPACALYAERMARLDGVLRDALVVPVPAVLAEQLQALAPAPAPVQDRLDHLLRDELVMPVPAALTAQLLTLVTQPAPAPSRLDAALRETLVVQAPPELTVRLQALVTQHTAPVSQPVPARPGKWVIATVYFVTAALLMLSLFYAGEVYGLLIQQLGLEAWLSQAAALPAELLSRLYTLVPQSRVVVGTFVRLQQPLQWLLVGLVMWAVIDMTQRQGQFARKYA